MSELFHAYIIGGAREDAKAYAQTLFIPGTLGYCSSEHANFGIEDARALREWQQLSAAPDETKVYVVYTDFITREAENALLKTLEEPASRTHIVLCIPNPEILLPTLRSRAHIYMARSGENSNEEAKKFLSATTGERMKMLAEILEKGDDEDASALVRTRALHLINGIEGELSTDVQKNREQLERILTLKKYIHIPGSSVRMILETIALVQ